MLSLAAFQPRPALVVKTSHVTAPRFPVIDAHNHLGEFGGNWASRPVQDLFNTLDQTNVQVYVDLDGGWGEEILDHRLATFKSAQPDRYRVFGGVDWSQWATYGDDFGEWAAERLRAQVARGADGLKIWKNLGLHVRDQHGNLVAIDDRRLDPLWRTAGELNIPVLIHIADPVAFFDPLDRNNERWEELWNHRDWHFAGPEYPPFMTLMDAFANLIVKHPGTDFIGAHVGCYAENLAWVSALLDRCPNFYVDISARIGELGRQPYSARRFFVDYADRILFGTDAGPRSDMYRIYYRFLETDDEYFSYDGRLGSGQGRWAIYGMFLPDDVLQKIYYRNAERLIVNRRG
jgi:predicted TIM-barrel fold metal-dependent hydrolase